MHYYRRLISLCLMLSLVGLAFAGQILGSDVSGKQPTGNELMQAFFGNYIPNLKASALDASSTTDPKLLDWRITARTDLTSLDGFDTLKDEDQTRLLGFLGKIPVKYMGHWYLGEDTALLLFEAGGWEDDLESWGGTGFSISHNLGGAVYTRSGGLWKCTGYELNLGKFGAYRTTTLNETPLDLGTNTYAIQTLDYGSALISVMDGKPKVILRNPCWHSFGHGSPESYESELILIPQKDGLSDILIRTTGEAYFDPEFFDPANYTLEEREAGTWSLFHKRTYRFDPKAGEYILLDSTGNIHDIREAGEAGWFPSDEDEF